MMQKTELLSLKKGYKICSNCIYDTSVPNIDFDLQGVCNYCRQTEDLIAEYGTQNEKGKKLLDEIVAEIKKSGRGKKYDCVIGVSGGTDSSYLLHWAKENGLRPIAAHYDNTFNTEIATENITKLTKVLDIDLYTHVVENDEMVDIYKSFFYSNVPELDAATDIACAEFLYRVASKFNLKYVIEGHSFLEEGITPIGKNYFDGKYVSGIHKLFGEIKMNTFPNMTFWSFMKWIMLKRIKKIRPFWYFNYSKEEAKRLLSKHYGWKDYGGHHLENRIVAFFHSVYAPQKFNIDYRNNNFAGVVRNGKMSREKAIKEYYETPPYIAPGLIEYVKKRMGFSEEEYKKIMNERPKFWYQYPTYKKRFERLKPLFYLLYKSNLVPKSFYLKYCFPVDITNNGY